MNQGGNKIIYKNLSYKIVGVLFDVYNELGYGYQEITYLKLAILAHFTSDGVKIFRAFNPNNRYL